MADKSFSLGQINITDYIIVRARKVSDSTAEVERQVFGPAPPTTQNFTFTDLDNDLYFFDVYESADGMALTTLFNTFEIDVATGSIITEYKFYEVDRGLTGDPAAGDTIITDSYLDGKNVVAFEQRGLGAMVPTDEWTRTSTGISLVAPLKFNADDIYVAIINYVQAGSSAGGNMGLFAGETTIAANTTLDSTYYNTLINLNGVGTQLVVTLDFVADVPDGTMFYFGDLEGGTQFQTKIKPQIGEAILWMGGMMAEMWVGKGETLWIKKSGTRYKVVQEHGNLQRVGQRFSGMYAGHPNTLVEASQILGADDFPRIWWWVVNKLPATSYVIDDTLDSGGYVRPANRQGQFIVSLTKRKFRMPDTQGLSEKGLTNFVAPGGDATRLVDQPGGFQPPALLQHVHLTHAGGTIDGAAGHLFMNRTGTGGQPKRFSGGGLDGLGGSVTPDETMLTGEAGGDDNIVSNYGVIYCTCV